MQATAEKLAVKERPILFSGPMVRALLAGRKTYTRRIHRFQPNYGLYAGQEWTCGLCDDGITWQFNSPLKADAWTGKCPYGHAGDRLWVRETFCILDRDHWWNDRLPRDAIYSVQNPRRNGCAYRAETSDEGERCRQQYGYKWTPAIHMPRWASRLTLEVTDVRVERLQAISHLDAMREGVEPSEDDWERFDEATIGMEGWEEPEELVEECEEECDWINYGNRLVEPQEHKEWERDRRAYACWFGFQRLWDRINGEGSWDANPWVWVVGFKCLKNEQTKHAEPSI